MKNINLVASIAIVLSVASLSVHSQITKSNANIGGLNIITVNNSNFRYADNNIPIAIVFENTSEETIRILDGLSKKGNLPAFFSFEIINKNGDVVFKTRKAKIEIPKDSMSYIEIKKGEKHKVVFELQDLISLEFIKNKVVNFSNGEYKSVVTYNSQYGDNCFRGKIRSPDVWLVLD
jgi:hypothetical protein